MKRMYTVAFYDDMLARIRETVPGRGRLERLHRRLLRRDRGVVRAHRRGWSSGPGSRTASSSSTAAGRGPRPTRSIADDVPEEVKKRRNNDLLAVQTAISLEDNRAVHRPDGEVLVEGPSDRRPVATAGRAIDQLTGRTGVRPDRGVRGARAAGRAVGHGRRSRTPAR